MKWEIHGYNGEGHISYDAASKKLEVSYTEEKILEQLTDYLTQEREFYYIVTDHYSNGKRKVRGVATDSQYFFEQALLEFESEHKFNILFRETNADNDIFKNDDVPLDDQQDRYLKFTKFVAYKRQAVDIFARLREYQDKYEYQFVEKYEENFYNFQPNSMRLGDVFPKIVYVGDRMVLVSVDFYKNQFRLADIVKWLKKNNIILGNKGSDKVIIRNANEMIQGLKFCGYPIVAYSRGNKSIRVDATKLVEITEKLICERLKIDTGESKDVQFGLTIIYNDECIDGIPRIDLDMSRDLVICNGAVIVADYIDEYHGCLAFFREEEQIPVSFILDTNTTIYIDSYERDDTGAMIYTIKYLYIIDLESVDNKSPVEEVPTPKIHNAVRTVPFDPKGREGVLIDDDGSMIYDDSWLHRDILDAEENDGSDKK